MASTFLLFSVFLQSTFGQKLTSDSTNFLPSFQDPGGDLRGLLGLSSQDPPPVFRYQPPSSGFLMPHQVVQGLQQLQQGRLPLENPPLSLTKLKSGEFTDSLGRVRETLTSEQMPSIAHIFKPFLSRRFGYPAEDREERVTDGISSKNDPADGHDSKKVRARRNIDEDDQLPLETSVITTEENYQVPSADGINSHVSLKSNAANDLTSFRVVDQSDDYQIQPSLVTSPFAEPPELRNRPAVTPNTIPSNPLISKETAYPTFNPESETTYTPSARINSPVFNTQPFTSSPGQKSHVYLPTEAKFKNTVEPEEGFIKSTDQISDTYPSQSPDGIFAQLENLKSDTYPAALSAQEQIAISHPNSGPAEALLEPTSHTTTENKYTTFTSFPSDEKNDNPATLMTSVEISGDNTFTGHTPASVEGKPLTYSPTVTQGTPIRPTVAPSASPGEISKDHLPTGHSHVSVENKPVPYTSTTITQAAPAQPIAVPVTSTGAPGPIVPSSQSVSSAVPFIPSSVLRGVTSHLRPIHTHTPLVTPFNPYTTLFQPPLGFGDGLKSYNAPLFNLGLGGSSYFK